MPDNLDQLIIDLRGPLYQYTLTLGEASSKEDTGRVRGAKKRNIQAKLAIKDLVLEYARTHGHGHVTFVNNPPTYEEHHEEPDMTPPHTMTLAAGNLRDIDEEEDPEREPRWTGR